jgi:hypothetical protein
MKMFQHLLHYIAEHFFECEIFQIKVVEKIKIHILFTKIIPFIEMLKNVLEPEAPDDYGGVLHTGLVWLHVCKHTPASMYTCTHTHKNREREICNSYCFPTAIIIS